MVCIVTLAMELLVAFVLTNEYGFIITDAEAVVGILLFAVSYIVTLYTSRKISKYRMVLLIGFLLRVFLLFWDLYGRNIYHLPSSGGDTERFFRAALSFAREKPHWENVAVTVFGTMIKLFGESRLWIQFLLMSLSVASSHITLAVMRMLDISKQSGKKAMWFMALLPMYAILSSIFLRESIITFFVSLSLFFFVKWWTRYKEIDFWMAVFFAFAGTIFHTGIAAIAVGFVLVRIIYDKKKDAFRLTATSIIVAVAFVAVFAFLYNQYSALFFKKIVGVEEISDIASGYGRGNSSYAAIAGNSNNLFNFIVYTPVRMFLFLFTPLPFQIRGFSDLIAMVFSVFFYFWTYYRVIKKIWNIKDGNTKHLMIALFVTALLIAFVFGWGGTNIGTQIRHRDKIMPVYIVLLSLCFEPAEERARKKKFRITLRPVED